ncbi:MAG: outer membrane beta-barrel protein [Pseudomonadota bacterium]
MTKWLLSATIPPACTASIYTKKEARMDLQKIWLTWACVAICHPAYATDLFTTKYNSYISVSGGRSSAPGTCTYLITAGANCSEKGTVVRLGYGYQLNRYLGFEISHGDFGTASEKGTLPSTPAGVPGSGPIPYRWEWTAIGWEVAATATLHLGESLSLTGKIGVFRADVGSEIIVTTSTNEIWHSVSRTTNNNTSRGLGIRYDFNRDFALRLQYENFGELGSSSKSKTAATYCGILLKF